MTTTSMQCHGGGRAACSVSKFIVRDAVVGRLRRRRAHHRSPHGKTCRSGHPRSPHGKTCRNGHRRSRPPTTANPGAQPATTPHRCRHCRINIVRRCFRHKSKKAKVHEGSDTLEDRRKDNSRHTRAQPPTNRNHHSHHAMPLLHTLARAHLLFRIGPRRIRASGPWHRVGDARTDSHRTTKHDQFH